MVRDTTTHEKATITTLDVISVPNQMIVSGATAQDQGSSRWLAMNGDVRSATNCEYHSNRPRTEPPTAPIKNPRMTSSAGHADVGTTVRPDSCPVLQYVPAPRWGLPNRNELMAPLRVPEFPCGQRCYDDQDLQGVQA